MPSISKKSKTKKPDDGGSIALLRANQVFEQTCAFFQERMTEDEKAQFSNFDSCIAMVNSLRSQCLRHPIRDSPLSKALEGISKLSDCLSPFFDIIGLFVASHPEYAAIAWGAMHLVFKLGTNHTTFLVKLSGMFEEMAEVLPAYGCALDTLGLHQDRKGHPFNPRLILSLSYVYTDVIQFCQEACQILNWKMNRRAKAKRVFQLCWKPFDTRFAEILTRFGKHSKLFELEMSNAHKSILLKQYDELERELKSLSTEHNDQQGRAETDSLRSRVNELKAWIDPPSWEDALEEADSARVEGTCEWLFDEPIYKSWASDALSSWKTNTAMASSVLLVEGKPGYGKTVLCASMVKHLRTSPTAGLAVSYIVDDTPNVAFHFFDQRHKRQTGTKDALRAIVAQLLHLDDGNRTAIDAVSLLQTKGQLTASGEELKSLLNWYLQHRPTTFLVFDALDESENPKEFVEYLENLTSPRVSVPAHTSAASASGPAIVLFTQPRVKIPLAMAEKCRKMSLNEHQNLPDLVDFLTPKINEQVQLGLLYSNIDVERTVQDAARHANGMFLWAKLLIEYLNSDALTRRERSDALDNLVLLKGLERLYGTILRLLTQKESKLALTNIRVIFHWVAGAITPLNVDALGTIMDIPHLRECISRISGALLEIAPDGIVRFIHGSVKSYLCEEIHGGDCGPDHTSGQPREFFRMDHAAFQIRAAVTCLRYLIESVPLEPLGGSPDVTVSLGSVLKRYPFVDYTARFWKVHLSVALLKYEGKNRAPDSHFNIAEMIHLLQLFVSSPETVKLWVEMCWVLLERPTVAEVGSAIESLQTMVQPLCVEASNFTSLQENLKHLQEDLEKLNAEWRSVLMNEPNEIWGPSITTLTPLRFMVPNPNARATKLCNVKATGRSSHLFITLTSQLAHDASEVAVLQLAVPRELTERFPQTDVTPNLAEWAKRNSSDWKAIFEVWQVCSKKMILKAEIVLPQTDVKPLLIVRKTENSINDPYAALGSTRPAYDPGSWRSPDNINLSGLSNFRRRPLLDLTPSSPNSQTYRAFSTAETNIFSPLDGVCVSIPFAVSDDLRKFLVLGSLVVLENVDPNRQDEKGWGCTPVVQELRPWKTRRGFSRSGNHLNVHKFGAKFGPSNKHLLIVRPVEFPVGKSGSPGWEMAVYLEVQDAQQPLSCRVYQAYSGDLHHWSNLEDVEESFSFHPYEPVLAFSLADRTVVWCFGGQKTCLVTVFNAALEKLKFTACGSYMHAKPPDWQGEGMYFGVSHHVKTALQQAGITQDLRSSVSPSCGMVPYAGAISRITFRDLASLQPSPTRKADDVVFGYDDRGIPTAYRLHQARTERAITIHTLSEDGIATVSTLSRIPEELLQSEAVLVTPSADTSDTKTDILRLVLNVRPKKEIRLLDDAKERAEMPTILERAQASITAFTTQLHPGVDIGTIHRVHNEPLQ